MVRESSLVQTPSLITRYRRRAVATLLSSISAKSLWPVCCGSYLLIKEEGYSQLPMFIWSVAVCYRLPSILETRTDWNSTSSSFCLRNHFLLLLNRFSNITRLFSSTTQSFSTDVSNFDLFSINLSSRKIFFRTSFG